MVECDDALLVIDVQNDFLAGGALAVPGGDAVVGPLNRLIDACGPTRVPVFASRDWHPPVTGHFKDYGGIWPTHCVAGTHGATFHPDLHIPSTTVVISAGEEADVDGYSAFDGTSGTGGRLADECAALGVKRVYVGGLATDYCVRASVLDALRIGLRVSLATDAVAAVNLRPGDGQRALDEMQSAGADLTTTNAILRTLAPDKRTRQHL